MPRSAPSRCTEPGCGQYATTRSRCDDHQRPAWSAPSKRNLLINRARWAKVRHAHLQREPHCAHCHTTEDLEVDHITEVADGGALYDHANLQTLCRTCHEHKTKQADRARRNR